MPQMVDGRYQLHEVIGSGGMATVWRGHDVQLDRAVAVKRPHPLPPGDHRHDRLAREARLAASVSHPNLVEVHDAGSDADGLFLVMEYIDAPSLGELRGSLDRGQILTAGSEVARALTAVHAVNVVHRDVKPANVLLPPTGAKLLDFGVALAAEPMPGFEPTMAGVVFGTKGYAAPEVMAGQPATAASDLFALGVMMFELLAGRQPFPDGNWVATPPTLDDPAGPFLAQCMALDPADRPSATLAANTLAQLASLPAAAPPVAAPTAAASTNDLPPPISETGGYDQTEVMPAPTVASASAEPPPPTTPPLGTPPPPGPPFSTPPPPGAPVQPERNRGSGIGWAVLAGVALVAVLFAVIGMVMSRQVDNGAASPSTGSLPAATATTTNQSTTTAPPTTTQPTTTESTTTTELSTTTDPGPGAETDAALAELSPDVTDDDAAEELAYETLREGLRGNGRNNDVAEKVAKKIGEAVKENRDGKPDEALKKLEDGAEEAADNLDGFARIWALAVLDSAARRMELGEPDFSIRFDPSNPLNEAGDPEGDDGDD